MTRKLLYLCLLVAPLIVRAQEQRPIIGTWAAEVRRSDGHFDTPGTIAVLKDMGANTYFYSIWHSKHDWDDLPEFARAAREAGIDVWIMLVPPSLTPLHKISYGFSEPYRVDYVRWAQEIARLSLEHPNIVGYVMDDFYTNSTQPERFTVEYTRKMVEAGRAINPRIKFYPLVYFQQPWSDFMERFGGMVDGVVAAYPRSRTGIGNALAYLNDRQHGSTLIVDHPRAASREGDKGSIVGEFVVKDPTSAGVSFFWDNTYHTEGGHGLHTAFVRVDGKMIWKSDIARNEADKVIDLDLSKYAKKGKTLRIEIGVYEARAGARFPITVRFDDIGVSGFEGREMTTDRDWRVQKSGQFVTNLQPRNESFERFRLPMILMPAGEQVQHEKRYPEAGSPRNIAARTRMAVEAAQGGRVEGVVMYCVPLDTRDGVYRAVRGELGALVRK